MTAMDPAKIPSACELELLSLIAGRECIGRGIAKEYAVRTGRKIPYGTLYTTLHKMEEAGWLESRDDMEHGRRIRIFWVLDAGAAALQRGRDRFRRLALMADDGLSALPEAM